MEENHGQNSPRPHVLLFPIPFQGPVNCFLKLAELLCLSGIDVTFLNTDHIHGPLLRHTDVLSRFNRYPNFRFKTVPDGVSHENPVSGDGFMEVMEAADAVSKPLFREMMVSGSLSSTSDHPVTVMIPDACFSFAVDIALETNTPVICFETVSPCCLWTSYLNLPTLAESGDFPFKGDDLDELVKSVPGIEGFLRRRDLASFCRTQDVSDPVIQLIMKEARSVPRTQGLILNTYEDLDALVLSPMRKLCPNIYPIGPLHSLHKARLMKQPTQSTPSTTFSNSVWKEDRTCLAWLDAHPTKSVVYVSLGSLATVTLDQLLEIWHGLVNSEKPFLWVRRPGSITGVYDEETMVPKELLDATKERGCIVGWAPQEDVLAHPAVGGFLTHSGWNSTIESIVEGVPMVCWPYFVDQQVNSRFVSEVWRLGIDLKDTCDRSFFEKAVRDVIDIKKEFIRSADDWANLATQAVSESGSSSTNLARLVEEIRALSSPCK